MKRFVTFFYNDRKPFSMILSVILSVLFTVGFVNAATTISTNISTGGTLSVTDQTSLGQASTTRLSVVNNAYFGATATSSFSSTGALTLKGDLTLQNDETISNSTNGTITLGATNMVLVGTASTSAIKVGDEPSATTINGLVMGYCSIATVTVNATSTAFADCTGATGVQVNDRVFVMATSSLPAGLVIGAASTSVAETINVRINNVNAGANTATGQISFNFWAAR